MKTEENSSPKPAVTRPRKRAASATWPATERRRNTDELQDMFDYCDIGFHTLNTEGTITMMNAVERRWLGYSSNEIIGCMNFMDLLAPEYRNDFATEIEQLRARGWVRHLEGRMRCRDSTTFPVQMHIVAIRNHDGHFLKFNVAVMNMAKHDQKEQTIRELGEEFAMQVSSQTAAPASIPALPMMERRRQPQLDGGPPPQAAPFGVERRRSILAAMTDGIVIFQADCSVVTCNPTAQRILGFSDAMLATGACPTPDWCVLAEDGSLTSAPTNPVQETARTGHACRDIILPVRRPDGSVRRVSVTTEPLFQPGKTAPQGVAMLITDVTDRYVQERRAT